MRVITYGTFDLFHEGHRRLLERARTLGSHLVVGVTTDNYDASRGKLNVRQSLMERVANVQNSGLADEVIIEEYEGQKVEDVQRLSIDVFAIGSDWLGKFDYLEDYCQVVYLERTRGISSTELRDGSGVIGIGIIGTGRIAHRMIAEARYVSGISVEVVYSRDQERADTFAANEQLRVSTTSLDELMAEVDAVYVASPHGSHHEHTMAALHAGKHVLCEKPLALEHASAELLFQAAAERKLVLMEAIKTAFAPGFQRMVAVARSGSIGQIRVVDATFTKLISSGRELQPPEGGSVSELASYPLLAIIRLLGTDFDRIDTVGFRHTSGVDAFARIGLRYPHAVATATVGIGVKSEGDLVVSGTRGYLYVPAPWWKTEFFEARFEDSRDNTSYYHKFEGDGLRYELAEFAELIRGNGRESFKLRRDESLKIAEIIEWSRANAEFVGEVRTR